MPASNTASARIHVFGVRHHGPGSARSVRAALERLKPDAILVEGPPDAGDVLALAGEAGMKPPVAILVYRPEEPRRAVYYPFAEFSPEWQAIGYAVKAGAAVRFMDLPQAHRMAMDEIEAADAAAAARPPEGDAGPSEAGAGPVPAQGPVPAKGGVPLPDDVESGRDNPTDTDVRRDPLGAIAAAAGFGDGERWWEHMVEHRGDDAGIFDAILEMIGALREHAPVRERPVDLLREAWMRRTVRAARKEGFANVAVVCGAWHAPALTRAGAEDDDAAADEALLGTLPGKVKVAATWVPWTYGRLAVSSGYGAGVVSPGWYDHLWQSRDRATVRWMTRVARLLRAEDLDASSASVIEAVRLAETLAAFRGRPLPGLAELNDAATGVFGHGSDVPMKLIHRRLIVGDRLGEVPEGVTAVPLQADLAREQKRVKLKPDVERETLELDLRKPTDLDRSRLLHRLKLLGVDWGEARRADSGKTGTYHEDWRLEWKPEFSVPLIEAGVWGNTVADASAALAVDRAAGAQDLPALTALIDHVLLADLPAAVGPVMKRLESEAAVASDVTHLMAALPPLANVVRYGNVRRADTAAVGHVVDGLVARVCIGLPPATASLNDEAADALFAHLLRAHEAIDLLQKPELQSQWRQALRALADQEGLHGLIAGRSCRLLLDAGDLPPDDAARRLSLALSRASDPARAAAWAEGFLRGSGLLLLHDPHLWDVIDDWLTRLPADTFTQTLPLLRRTFSTFEPPERRQMGERAKRGAKTPSRATAPAATEDDFDVSRAEAVLPAVAKLLGLQ